MSSILVITSGGDIHAAAFKNRLGKIGDCECLTFSVDNISHRDALSWSLDHGNSPELMLVVDEGVTVPIGDIGAIWWRRFNAIPELTKYELDVKEVDLIHNDCRASIIGALLTCFKGAWINHPVATNNAENKLLQLQAAQLAGFRVPATLVSNQPSEIRNFCARFKSQVIVKPVKGTRHFTLFTRKVSREHLGNDQSIRLAPAIYQEFIPGDRHLRVHCFGESFFAICIKSSDLDWRENLDVHFELVELSNRVEHALTKILSSLNLRMGIVDLKLMPDGTPVFLEINPQGQFLFSEGLSGVSLLDSFVSFILSENQPKCGQI